MRFKFGENWYNYVQNIDEESIKASIKKLKQFLDFDLTNKTFLDIGCGSGIHSLAAVSEGAKVFSFDYDTNSVKATQMVKEIYKIEDEKWEVEKGDILDEEYISKLSTYDVVYSWGVLHHTGNMWKALDNAARFVNKGGYLFIAIYNDQGIKSKFWWGVKYIYNILPKYLNKIYGYTAGVLFQLINIVKYTLMLKPMVAIRPLINYKKNRGMTIFHDMIDWMGGYPFEVAKYEKLIEFYEGKGFTFIKGNKATSLGCHEIVFKKNT